MVNEHEFIESDHLFSPADDTDLDPDFLFYSDVSSSTCDSLKVVKRRKIRHKPNNKCNSSSSKSNSYFSLPDDDGVFFDDVTLEKQILQDEQMKVPFFNLTEVEELKSKVNVVSASDSILNTTTISRSSSGYLSCSDFDQSLSTYVCEMSSEVDNICDHESDGRNSNNSSNMESVLNEDDSLSHNYEGTKHENHWKESGGLLKAFQETNINPMKVLQILDPYYYLSEQTITMLKKLDIEIAWVLPIAHSHPSSYLEYNHAEIAKELEKEGMKLQTGRFTSEEDSIIISNWECFKKTYGFEDPSLFFPCNLPKKLFRNKEKNKFVQYLGYGLNNRTLRSIHNRFKAIYGKMLYSRSGRFYVKEEQFIMEVNKLPKSIFNSRFKKVSLMQSVLMMREVPIRRKRYLLEKNPLPAKRIIWTLQKMTKLVRLILERCDSNDFMSVESELTSKDWSIIADNLGFGCGKQLEMFWMSRLLVQLTSENPIYRNKLRSDLIVRLQEWVVLNEQCSWNEVDWYEISSDLSLPPFFLYKKFRKMAVTYVPAVKLDSVESTVQHLCDNFLPILQSGKLKDYCLKRLKYTDNKTLVEID